MANAKNPAVPALIKREIDRALSALNAAAQFGYSYAVHTPDGKKLGNLKAAPGATLKRVVVNERGTLKQIYEPFIANLKAGELAVVPCGEFKPEEVRASLSAYCTSHWGKGAHTSYIDNKAKEVQVMRIL